MDKKHLEKNNQDNSSSEEPEAAKGYRIRKHPNLQFIVSDIRKRQYHDLFNTKTVQMLCRKTIQFHHQEYSTFCFKQIFINLRKINMQKLILNYTLNHKILKQIEHIDFPSLKQLSLNSNILSNVQSLGYLNMPQLQYLDLSDNNITNLKPLVKSRFALLQKIVLYDIAINQIQFLSQMSSTKLSKLHLQTDQYSVKLSQTVSVVAKLMVQNQIKQLYVENRFRQILQKKVVQALKENIAQQP